MRATQRDQFLLQRNHRLVGHGVFFLRHIPRMLQLDVKRHDRIFHIAQGQLFGQKLGKTHRVYLVVQRRQGGKRNADPGSIDSTPRTTSLASAHSGCSA